MPQSRSTITLGLPAILLVAATAAAAVPPELTPQQFLDICRSASVEAAREKGDRLGWQQLPDDPKWRRAFESFNKGSVVQAVGWRRGDDPKSGHLSVWMSQGALASRTCAYSAPSAPGFREALVATWGSPDSDDTSIIGKSTSWLRGGVFVHQSTLEPGGLVSITIAEKF